MSRVGLTLRQINLRTGQISNSALDFDTLRLIPDLSAEEEMDPTTRDGSVAIMDLDGRAGGRGAEDDGDDAVGRKEAPHHDRDRLLQEMARNLCRQ